jgi:hypothetical protein
LPSPRPAQRTTFPLTVLAVDTKGTVDTSAVLHFEDRVVAPGIWSTDSLDPGRYRVSATVKTKAGCPTATVTETVTVGPTTADTVRLYPRNCGLLIINVRYGGPNSPPYTYQLSAAGWKEAIKTTPKDNKISVMAPVGPVQIIVKAGKCADYRSTDKRVGPGQTVVPVTLICGEG